jgi:hypothetical protein
MYKTPELTQMAKVLAEELAGRGVQLKHTQAMSTVARMLGARTLQVAQSSPNIAAGVRTRAIAIAQAARVMFETLGRFEGDPYAVLAAIRAGFALEEAHGSRSVEHAMHELFGQADSPVVSEAYSVHTLDDLPALFDTLVERLADSLLAGQKPKQGDCEVLYRGFMRDYRFDEGIALAEIPESHRTQFEVKVQRRGAHVLLDITQPHLTPEEVAGTDQMSLWVEINEGRPCAHVSNDVYGDSVLSLFATKDGVVVRPDEAQVTSYPPRPNTALAEFVDEQYGKPGTGSDAWALSFAHHKNYDHEV